MSATHSKAQKFLVATETGILHRMRKSSPDKIFLPVKDDAECMYMKRITLEKLHYSLKHIVYEVNVDESIARKARQAINHMLEFT